jgi:uncharacterized DUF497 family protein
MIFEWDEPKSNACFKFRGFDFAYVVQAFLDPYRVVTSDQRYNYGEDRFELLGQIDSRIYVVIYTPRAKAIRIISARKANLREIKRYENSSYDN